LQLQRIASGSAALAFLLIAGGAAFAQQVDCQGGFTALRAEYEKHGKAIEAANKRKAPVQEACTLFKPLLDAQSKMLKFLKDNKVACNVPDEVMKTLAAGVARTAAVKTQVCNAATSGGGPRPPSAGLSGAINVTGDVGGPPPETNNSGNLFDTINGNILQR